jgi:hypothetical protein
MSHSYSRTACNLLIIILFLFVIHSEFRTTTHGNHYQPYTKNYEINYLTMASSTLGLTLNRAPFPLVKEVLMEESTFVEISTKVQVGGQGNNAQWEKRTVKIRKIDHLDKELMMNSIIEFEDACAPGRLNLSTGEKLYPRFRELLGEVFHVDWTTPVRARPIWLLGSTKPSTISSPYTSATLI